MIALFDLPLLGKDLTEYASRPRNYLLRVVYAVMLYGAFLLLFRDQLVSTNLNTLGAGRQLADGVMGLLFAAVCLVIPGAMAGSIAAERSSGTLPLLMLTGMPTWELVFQKFAGQLLPLITWILLVLPLMAIAYSLGGVETGKVWAGAWAILASACLLGAYAQREALRAPDPSRSVMTVYLRTTLLLPIYLILHSIWISLLFGLLGAVVGLNELAFFALGLFPPISYFALTPFISPWIYPFTLLPAFIATLIMLRRTTLDFEQVLDQRKRGEGVLDTALIQAARGGVRRAQQIDQRPLAWLERSRLMATFGSFTISLTITVYFFLFVSIVLSSGWSGREFGWGSGVNVALWAALIIGIIVVTTSALTSERSTGAHDVLLTTTLSGNEIVTDKLVAARKMMLSALGPLALMWLVVAFRERGTPFPLWYLFWVPICFGLTAISATWLCALVALWIRHRQRALMVIAVIMAGWCLLPLWLSDVLSDIIGPAEWLWWASPLGLILAVEFPNTYWQAVNDSANLTMACAALWFLSVWLGLRILILRRADRLLGRAT